MRRLSEIDRNGMNTVEATYRLVHSSGELAFRRLVDACAAMRERPGARVFVAPGRSTGSLAPKASAH